MTFLFTQKFKSITYNIESLDLLLDKQVVASYLLIKNMSHSSIKKLGMTHVFETTIKQPNDNLLILPT